MSAASSIAPANVRAAHDGVDQRHQRRIAHRPAELQLALVERRVVLPARELDAVVIGIERLDDRFARLLAAAGAAGDLRQQLKRPLRRAEVGQAEADVGRHDADQRDARKVVALGDHLRADEHVDLAVAEPRQQRRRARPCGGRRRDRAARRARPGQARLHFGLDPLGAEAGLLEIRRRRTAGTPSARAPSSCSSGSARAARCPRRARRATRCSSDSRSCRRTGGRTPPSRSRGGSAGRAPARCRSSRAPMRLAQRAAEDRRPGPRPRTPRACRRRVTDGERPIEHAALEHDALVLAGHRVVVALHRRRRRAEHDQRAGALRAHDRDVAAVVARALLLLVRAVVLLVDDDQADVARAARTPPSACRRRRRRRRGGCAATDRAARRRRGRCAESRRGRRTPARNSAATAGVSAISGTSISTRRPAARTAADEAEVDLGLAAAGDAVQQRDAEGAARRRARAAASSARVLLARSAAGRRSTGVGRSSRPTPSNGSRSTRSWRRLIQPRLARRAIASAAIPRAASSGVGNARRRAGEQLERLALLRRQRRRRRPSRLECPAARDRRDARRLVRVGAAAARLRRQHAVIVSPTPAA